MFKNHSLQKAILVLTILALLAGTTFVIRPHAFLLAGLPPCSATSGNCKLGLSGVASLGDQMAILIHFPVLPGEQMAILIHVPVAGS